MGFPAPGAYEASIARINEQRRAASQVQTQQRFLNQAIGASNQANVANRKRELEVRAIYDETINRYKPGGAFETRSLAQLEKQKSRFIEQGYGEAVQGDISRGIYGTTESGARKGRLRTEFESEVGAPSRLRLEDVMMQRLSSAQQGMAGFLTGIEDTGPSLSQLYGMGSAAGSASGGGVSSASSGGTKAPNMATLPAATSQTSGQSTQGTSRTVQGYGTDYYKQKRLADEAAAKKLQAKGTLSYGPGQLKSSGGTTGTAKTIDTSGWTAAEKRSWANYVPGVSGYNVAAMKARQGA